MVGISVCFFYYLPINHSISSTSNQIIIVYQTGLIFVGAVVMYKTVFKRRNPIIKALDNCDGSVKKTLTSHTESAADSEPKEWQTITDQEKITIFYQHMIAKFIPSQEQELETSASTSQPPASDRLWIVRVCNSSSYNIAISSHIPLQLQYYYYVQLILLYFNAICM